MCKNKTTSVRFVALSIHGKQPSKCVCRKRGRLGEASAYGGSVRVIVSSNLMTNALLSFQKALCNKIHLLSEIHRTNTFNICEVNPNIRRGSLTRETLP